LLHGQPKAQALAAVSGEPQSSVLQLYLLVPLLCFHHYALTSGVAIFVFLGFFHRLQLFVVVVVFLLRRLPF
jgi:hypothetical protein